MSEPRDSPGPVLLVEEDADLVELLVALFSANGYRIDVARDGQRGLHLALQQRYGVIVLDRGLPAIDGVDLVTRLRRRAVAARVLILGARADPTERVRGLDAGADDYLGKPFDSAELMARVRALTRRRFDAAELIPIGAGQLDLDQRSVRLPDGRAVPLSGREFDLIRTLASHPQAVHSRGQLRRRVFGADRSATVVDTYVHYLRRKLGERVVRTVHGLGYQIGTL
ncbi:response regulator transcription factor [Micromonospora endophytica]|uniref:Two-component system response regulator n=1 Tax=Micromonospora endophytica TaxID=515350 RepID=A0A2W2D0S1_9ACTN|nr:response regulator transcription factor [Micromonospora endophytica]PZF93727.1 two-component system response regulator [Micromonospora endophytica]RIW41766.1 DNA-binding response regulator [Micromonospora endophytica]BCJ62967.1 transcriptional regulator [Micromonospora endophytica]